tara:strand:+ start:835 stop:1986 length:1152 start_codon:yes stop_codon:yes gene_type:complete
MGGTTNDFQISPSSWNRFEECPRKYWLSRQRLPRKASMAASMGTAIHNSVEDMCNLDMSGWDDEEIGWLHSSCRETLQKRWEEERTLFSETPRHPRWKDESFSVALDGMIGAISILFDKAMLPLEELSSVTVKIWKQVQDIVVATEANLESKCGRLMGRLDLLIKDLEDEANDGLIVADLKTGKPPEDELSEKVSRQLLFYRDIMKENVRENQDLRAEGWYSSNNTVYRAEGPSILEEAIGAWEMMKLTETPFPATPSEEACSFCEWKAWCPRWWVAKYEGELSQEGMFRDEVVRLIRLDQESGAALFERTTPEGGKGELRGSDHRFGALLKGRSLEKIRQMDQAELDGYLFLGSIMFGGKTPRMGDWSEILPWSPLLRSVRN